ncbi:MFS transporter [Actinomadura geliboluensis]|uniref:MFS transporter n=1 Tax=Actinomadura geliboluensis TaxID=882440 RepID=UPI0036B12446
MLLAARFVTGVAAAFMAPAGLALVTSTFPEGPARTRALEVYAGTAAGGFSLGLVAGGVLAVVAVERRSRSPLVRLGILRTVPLVRVNAAALLFLGAFAGFQFLATLYFQEVRGWSTMQTGLAMLVIGVDTVLAPTLTPRLVNRFGNTRVLFGGMLLAAAGYALFLPVGADWAYTAMLPSLVLLGLAFSLCYGPLTMAATEGVEEGEHGLAGGLLYTSFQFGTALGLSAVTAVSVAAGTGLDALRTALAVPAAAAALGAVVIAFGLRTPAAPDEASTTGSTHAEPAKTAA